ncbi:GyrI-like domain-containing protein [Chimaeribacter arupi]|uniref:GyrI-like domain-containing protein n=1 Tax=Chimaeribacter arupi TaxID=2060066 RepID=UPI0027120FB6|nr:GyrI-like domain-containing protein [Chimaeribacter arupi]WKZ90645.1 GyrI-like domain-containing protein [Chimaeribacter arupi]
MSLIIMEQPEQTVYGVRVVGPYERTIPLGFTQLTRWRKARNITGGDIMTLYLDNPLTVAQETLRADVVFTFEEGMTLPPPEQMTRGNVRITGQVIPGGIYAMWRTRVFKTDFVKAWREFYEQRLLESEYRPCLGACYERYLNEGAEADYFDIEIHQTVCLRASLESGAVLPAPDRR